MNEGKKFLDELAVAVRMMSATAQRTCASRPSECAFLLDPLARWSEGAFGNDIYTKAAKGYARYCLHVAQAQRTYESTGKYTPEHLDEIIEHVYEDPEYMVPYMWAAVLIYAFWPSMVDHVALFRDQFLSKLPDRPRVLELGCGHGVLGLLAAEYRRDSRVHGIDLSPSAIDIALRLLAVTGYSDRVTFSVMDATTIDENHGPGSYDGIIIAMLVEHVLDPRPLVAAVKRNLAPGGIVFFSTAIESPQRDHVYEFHRESEVIQLIEDCGLRARATVSNGSRPFPQAKFCPRAIAAILEHS